MKAFSFIEPVCKDWERWIFFKCPTIGCPQVTHIRSKETQKLKGKGKGKGKILHANNNQKKARMSNLIPDADQWNGIENSDINLHNNGH